LNKCLNSREGKGADKMAFQKCKISAFSRENGISGRVIVNFVVDGTGAITDIKILGGIGGGCDEEAIR